MKVSTYVNRTTWGHGPWDGEPDRAQFRDEETGFQCLVRRGGGGAWCGYVGVPPGHPWHGKGWSEVDAEVHGGITYDAPCDDSPERGICHVPEPGDTPHLWWVGFDCNHSGDEAPEWAGSFMDRGGVYRDFDFVVRETRSLARQAKAAAEAAEVEGVPV